MEERGKKGKVEEGAGSGIDLAQAGDGPFLRVLLDNLSEGIVACDRDGQLVLFNRASRDFHGLPPLPGPADEWARHYSLFEADGKTPLIKSRIPLFRAFNGETVTNQQISIAPHGLPVRQVLTNAQPIFDAAGQCVGALAAMRDVSDQIVAETKLSEVELLAQVTLNAIGDGVIRMDRNETIEYCNPAAARLLRVSENEFVGQQFSDAIFLACPGRGSDAANPVSESLRLAKSFRLQSFSQMRTRSGHEQRVCGGISPICNHQGMVTGAVVVFQDSALVRANAEEMHALLRTDPLTGIPSRLGCEDRLRDLFAQPADQWPLTHLIFIDLDHFRIVNSTCGSIGGDQILRRAAVALQSLIGTGDFAARVGGDQFVVLTRFQSEREGEQYISAIYAAFDRVRFTFENRESTVGINLGLIGLAECNDSPGEALARAEAACDIAKDRGRGRPVFYAMADAAIRLQREFPLWVQRIRSAFDNDAFELFFERIVDARGSVRGYEALLRMRDPEGKIVFPSTIFPVIKKMGWGIRLDQWVVRRALSYLTGTGPQAIPEGHYLSVNVSARSLADQSFAGWLLENLGKVAPSINHFDSRLHIEITETDELATGNCELSVLEKLRSMGVSVWLDDFGAGYNSFELLKRISVDGIKIDRAFTSDLGRNVVGAALVSASLELSRHLDFDIVAEGIEDQRCADRLEGLGVTAFQGWLFHRASPLEEAVEHSSPPVPVHVAAPVTESP